MTPQEFREAVGTYQYSDKDTVVGELFDKAINKILRWFKFAIDHHNTELEANIDIYVPRSYGDTKAGLNAVLDRIKLFLKEAYPEMSFGYSSKSCMTFSNSSNRYQVYIFPIKQKKSFWNILKK